MATLLDKIWDAHRVVTLENGDDLLYIDLHLVHEVTSPQAFSGLRLAGRKVRRPDLTFATMDHNVPTKDIHRLEDAVARAQLQALATNCRDFQIPLFDLEDDRQGIVHVVGPELGLTQPGQTIVCGDSHTSTHGAFGALAFGIGTSEVEHVLATQTLRARKPTSFAVTFEGIPTKGVFAKDWILALIGIIGTAGGTGSVFEFGGRAIAGLSMEARMSICNMSIEAGARAGMIAPDQTTLDYVLRANRPYAPAASKALEDSWRSLASDPNSTHARRAHLDVGQLEPQVTWGTSPGMVAGITESVPHPDQVQQRWAHLRPEDAAHALRYTDLRPGDPLLGTPLDVIFLGSCTNSRIEDLRLAAGILAGKRVSNRVQVLVVPGSRQVKREAEREGLDRIFREAGCEWREPGCSLCLGMNPDQLLSGQRCLSTSNRNFEGRQGKNSRTHLASPATAAASALAGCIADPREVL